MLCGSVSAKTARRACTREAHWREQDDREKVIVVDGNVHMHDLHATLLHMLGLDHERLTFSYAGPDGCVVHVVKESLA